MILARYNIVAAIQNCNGLSYDEKRMMVAIIRVLGPSDKELLARALVLVGLPCALVGAVLAWFMLS